MARPTRLLAFLLCLSALAPNVRAQQATAQQKKTAPKKTTAEADPLAEVRRASAISLVNALADEARTFRDPTLRSRVQARAADALWDTDKERARTLFRRAWDEAEAADDEADRRVEADRQRQMRERGAFVTHLPPSLRTEVLRLAAKRDRALGEEFLAKMDEARKREAENAATSNERPTDSARPNDDAQQPSVSRLPNPLDPISTPPAVAKRLRLAIQLLEDGDTERALQFADPALGSVNSPTLEFLARLRQKNEQAADERYPALVNRARADPSSDANVASVLSAYLPTPPP